MDDLKLDVAVLTGLYSTLTKLQLTFLPDHPDPKVHEHVAYVWFDMRVYPNGVSLALYGEGVSGQRVRASHLMSWAVLSDGVPVVERRVEVLLDEFDTAVFKMIEKDRTDGQ